MDSTRTLPLTKQDLDGKAVLYVMSRDQRVQDNHALIAAQQEANEKQVPLYVLFNLKRIESRAREHYEFMLAGLREVAKELNELNIPFIIQTSDAYENILSVSSTIEAGSIYFDFSPLNHSRELAKKVASNFGGSSYVVDTHNIIPVWVVSDKQEFAAHTMRRKVHKQIEQYMVEPPIITRHAYSADTKVKGMSFDEAIDFIATIPSRGIVVDAKPGQIAAAQHLNDFLEQRLDNYSLKRNDIANDEQSGLSPYLHFGQISSLRVALETIKFTDRRPLLFDEVRLASAGEAPSIYDGMNALLEEMIVRKELSDNFCFYQKDYTKLSAGPDWAQQSLALHKSDIREFVYTRKQWENAQTHDESWNAAQNQLRQTGKIHGYMRMYWAKKMLEWSETPEVALEDCIYLNDAYSIDGGDPNGYVGILWSIVGLHDRPWSERSVFGKIRYMNEAGLKRKYDLQSYQRTWNSKK